MPSISISIETAAGGQKIARLLKVIEPKTLLTAVGGRFLSHVDKQFKTHGEGRWRPLSSLTLALRKRGGDQPLQDTGHYKQSFVPETDDQTYVEVGTNLKTPSGLSLGKIHEFGTGPFTIRVKRAKVLAAQTRAGAWLFFGKEVHHPGIPARPVLPTQPVAEKMIQTTVDAMLAIATKE